MSVCRVCMMCECEPVCVGVAVGRVRVSGLGN